jgi:hypothetical protein
MRRNFLLLAIGAVALPLAAKSPVDAVHKDKDLAIHGYDVVSYFTAGRPAKGSPQFTADWMGAKWRFTSAENRDLFQKEPANCAWAVSKGYTANGDPEAWRIVNGRLYLNYNKRIQKKWEQDPAARINEGDRNWPGLHK